MFSNSHTGVNVDGAKFISGDDNLKSLAEALRTAKYQVVFPDDSPTKVLRRGTLSCWKDSGDCRFVLQLPQDVQSVN